MKTIFITGAAMGIGKACAEHFYIEGWTLGLVDVNAKALQEFCRDKDLSRISYFHLDISDTNAVRKAIDTFCLQNNGRLDVLLNNAGILRVGDFYALPIEAHLSTMNVNVGGVMNCMDTAFTYLKRTPNSTVINLSSASALYGTPEMASYAASKAAIRSLTESLRIEWGEHGIRVCSVDPPFVDTNMLESQSMKSKILRRLGVHLVAEDVVRAVIKQTKRPRLHRPVGWQYSILHYTAAFLPRFLIGGVMKLITR